MAPAAAMLVFSSMDDNGQQHYEGGGETTIKMNNNKRMMYPRRTSSQSLGHDENYDYNNDDEDDCKSIQSVRSLPLLKDDDYYFYNGSCSGCDDDGSDDEDEEVDHIKTLIRPRHLPMAMMSLHNNNHHNEPVLSLESENGIRKNKKDVDDEHQFRLSLQSVRSDLTFDDEGDISPNNSNVHFPPTTPAAAAAASAKTQGNGGEPSDEQVEPPSKSHNQEKRGSSCPRDDVSIQDFITLKMRVAELESQLQLRRQNDSLQSLLSTLQYENIGLTAKLQDVRSEMLHDQFESRQVQSYMQYKVCNLKKEVNRLNKVNDLLQEENRRLRETLTKEREVNRDKGNNRGRQLQQQQGGDSIGTTNPPSFNRRSSTGDIKSPYVELVNKIPSSSSSSASRDKEEVYVPFPKTRYRTQTVSGPKPHRRASLIRLGIGHTQLSSSDIVCHRRPSLLDVLRSSFNKSTSSVGNIEPSSLLEYSETSRNTSATGTLTTAAETTTTHESWAATDEINAQTELFNRQSNARLMAARIQRQQEQGQPQQAQQVKYEREAEDHEESIKSDIVFNEQRRRPVLSRRSSYSDCPRNANTTTSSSPPLSQGERPKPKRRKSFTLGESIRSLCGNGSSDDEFDVNSVLWDDDDDDDDKSISTRKSVSTSAF